MRPGKLVAQGWENCDPAFVVWAGKVVVGSVGFEIHHTGAVNGDFGSVRPVLPTYQFYEGGVILALPFFRFLFAAAYATGQFYHRTPRQ